MGGILYSFAVRRLLTHRWSSRKWRQKSSRGPIAKARGVRGSGPIAKTGCGGGGPIAKATRGSNRDLALSGGRPTVCGGGFPELSLDVHVDALAGWRVRPPPVSDCRPWV